MASVFAIFSWPARCFVCVRACGQQWDTAGEYSGDRGMRGDEADIDVGLRLKLERLERGGLEATRERRHGAPHPASERCASLHWTRR